MTVLARRLPLVVLASISVAMTAAAEVPNLALTWEAPAGCPSRAKVEAQVDRLLGDRPRDERKIDARVVVTQRGSGLWVADLVISGSAKGSRQIEGESCGAIALATAVVLAFAIDPRASPAPTEPPERPAPPPPEKPAVIEPTAVPVVPFVHAFGGAALRTLPAVAPALGIGVGARREHWEAELMAAYAPAHSVQLSGPPRAGADIDLLSVAALGCFAPVATPAASLGLCAGGVLERMSAQASGVSNPGSGAALLLSPLAAIRSETRLARQLSLVLDLGATVRPFRSQFIIDGVGQVYDIPAVGFSLGGGLQLRL